MQNIEKNIVQEENLDSIAALDVAKNKEIQSEIAFEKEEEKGLKKLVNSLLGKDKSKKGKENQEDRREKFDEVGDFFEGRARVKKGDKAGFVDEAGNIVIPLLYDDVYDFKDGKAMIEMDYKIGYIDLAGNVLIPAIYNSIGEFKDGRAHVTKDSSKPGVVFQGYIDANGKEVIPVKYLVIDDFDQDGIARVQSSREKWGIINYEGELVVPFIYDDISPFEGDIARVEIEKNEQDDWNIGYINKKGEVVVPLDYIDARVVADSIVKVKSKNLGWGMIDLNLKQLTSVRYNSIGAFKDGKAPIERKDGTKAYIDTLGNEIEMIKKKEK